MGSSAIDLRSSDKVTSRRYLLKEIADKISADAQKIGAELAGQLGIRGLPGLVIDDHQCILKDILCVILCSSTILYPLSDSRKRSVQMD